MTTQLEPATLRRELRALQEELKNAHLHLTAIIGEVSSMPDERLREFAEDARKCLAALGTYVKAMAETSDKRQPASCTPRAQVAALTTPSSSPGGI